MYRDKRSASPSKRKKEEKKRKGEKKKSSTPSQRTFLPRSQRGRLSVSSLRPLVSSASAKVSLPNSGEFRTLDTSKLGLNTNVNEVTPFSLLSQIFSIETAIDFSICATTCIEYYVLTPTYNSLLLEKYYVDIRRSLSLSLSILFPRTVCISVKNTHNKCPRANTFIRPLATSSVLSRALYTQTFPSLIESFLLFHNRRAFCRC